MRASRKAQRRPGSRSREIARRTSADRPTLPGGRGTPGRSAYAAARPRGWRGWRGAVPKPPKKSRSDGCRSGPAARAARLGRAAWPFLLRLSGCCGSSSCFCRWRRRHRSARRCRCHRRVALGLFAADFAARPGKIVGAAGRRGQRLTLHQRPRGERIDRGRTRARTAEQLIGTDGRCHQRQDRSGQRTRRRLAGNGIGVGRRRLDRQRDRPGARREQAGHLALDIVRELARAGLGEDRRRRRCATGGSGLRSRGPSAGSGRPHRQSRPRHRHR